MQHLIFSCLESRVESNGALFGRYLLGPLRIGQATTMATALRRSLLSEVQGIAITAVEISGASHQYSSIKGVRESVLDIILNLKQVVLSGTTTHDLPAIGYLEIQGPRAVIANDLMLPNGICCVNTNQVIATLSANGLLKMKFVISGGKSCITPYAESAHKISKKIFTPKTYWREDEKLPLYRRKQLKQIKERTSQTRSLLLSKKLSTTIWGKEEPVPSKIEPNLSTFCEASKVIVYNQKRRSSVTSPLIVQSFDQNSGLSAKGNTLSVAQNYSSQKPKNAQPLKSLQEDLLSTNDLKKLVDEKHIAAAAAKRFNRRLQSLELKTFVKDRIKPIFYSKPIEKALPNPLGKKENRFILSVDPVFSPITRVNFAIQIDDQWQEPRERIVFEIWSNGSIHPRQAISEAATNLVYLFSLLR
jgi:DNA-directed RNA polymerase alpha subunit